MRRFGNILFIPFFWNLFLLVKLLTLLAPLYRRKKSSSLKSVLYLEIFPIENAGYTYRAAKWAELFKTQGLQSAVLCLIADKDKFQQALQSMGRAFFFMRILTIRFFQIFTCLSYDVVIVRRELLIYFDYGNLFFEKWLHAIHPLVVLDFDDDIAAAKREPRVVSSLYGKLLLENGNKFTDSLQCYRNFVVGSSYLQSRLPASARSVVIPTCVDYLKYTAKEYQNDSKPIVFGWIGGNQNLKLLHQITFALEALNKEYPLALLVISGNAFTAQVSYPIINEKWSLSTEVDSIRKMDIGIMPLANTDIAKGKCGFKLIQYMGLGVVSIASAITVNNEIIDHTRNGFLVQEEQDWLEVMRQCIQSRARWPQIGTAAREKIRQHYSFESLLPAYLQFLQEVSRV